MPTATGINREVLALPRLDHLIWGIVATVAAIVGAAPAVSNFHIVSARLGALDPSESRVDWVERP